MEIRDYMDCAKDNLDYVEFTKSHMLFKNYELLTQYQQSIEKLCKYILQKENRLDKSNLAYTHNIRSLYLKVFSIELVSGDTSKVLNSLKEAYYNVRYPSDEYRKYTKEKWARDVKVSERIIDELHLYIRKHINNQNTKNEMEITKSNKFN